MLKTVVLLNNYVEVMISYNLFDAYKNQKNSIYVKQKYFVTL